MSDHKKRATTAGFDGVGGMLTTKRLFNMGGKNPEGDWRKNKVVRLAHTIIERTWTYNERNHIDKTISPWGMRNYMKTLLSDPKCSSSYDVIPPDVRKGLGTDDMKSTFKTEVRPNIQITVRDKGHIGCKDLVILYCQQ